MPHVYYENRPISPNITYSYLQVSPNITYSYVQVSPNITYSYLQVGSVHVTIECDSKHDGSQNFLWTADFNHLITDTRWTTSYTRGLAIISKVLPLDTGRYACQYTSHYGGKAIRHHQIVVYTLPHNTVVVTFQYKTMNCTEKSADEDAVSSTY